MRRIKISRTRLDRLRRLENIIYHRNNYRQTIKIKRGEVYQLLVEFGNVCGHWYFDFAVDFFVANVKRDQVCRHGSAVRWNLTTRFRDNRICSLQSRKTIRKMKLEQPIQYLHTKMTVLSSDDPNDGLRRQRAVKFKNANLCHLSKSKRWAISE